METMLITGVSGLLGHSLARLFADACNVVGVYRTHPVRIPGVRCVACDLADYPSTRALIADAAPDVVVHCASRTDVDGMELDPEGAWTANVRTTRNVVDALRDTDARLVFLSTDSVYPGDEGPYGEDGPCLPRNVYGRTKLEAEGVALGRPGTLVLRTNLFGWNLLRKRSIAEWFLAALESGEGCVGFEDARFNGIYCRLLGVLVCKCLERGLSGVYNCASRDAMSKYRFGCELARTFGHDPALIRPGSIEGAHLGAPRGHDMRMDMTALEAALGEPLPTMTDSIEAFAADHRAGLPARWRESMAGLPDHVYFPQRENLPYGGQCIDEDDVRAVCRVLRSAYLTTGPTVGQFEEAVCAVAGARHGVAVSSGTAALHAAMFALGIGPGDEVIVPAMTFAASANCVLYQGGTPVFADVDPDTLLMDPASAQAAITPRTRAIIAVDYAGQPCEWEALRAQADRHGLALVADGCHALGASLAGRPVGTLADMTCFSFHPVKHVATGEGGMVVTDDDALAERLRLFRNHGITTDSRQREEAGSWFYAMEELGYNYRLTDIQSALGLSQMAKLPAFLARRREIAALYDAAFAGTPVRPLRLLPGREHAYHLYVVRLENRDHVFDTLRAQGIGVNVHYIPVHLHPYYREHLGTAPGDCPAAERAYGEILSLPIFVGMTDEDAGRVVEVLRENV